jgi:hypothetical protein
MSNKSKLAAIAAASIGMVLTQSSAPRAETKDNSAPEKLTKIAAPMDVNEDVFYSAIPDDALERVAGSLCSTQTAYNCWSALCNKGQPVKKPPTSQSKKQKQ